ncbi:LVIVD repeat protein [uncultured archaeon]|nr:LVIVD repeat protein [uncultured archaeon]
MAGQRDTSVDLLGRECGVSRDLNRMKCTERGFVFSLDATIAMILLGSAMFMLVALQQENAISPGQSSVLAEDSLFAMDNSGYILRTIDTNSVSQSAALIRGRLLESIPAGFDANVSVRSYTSIPQECGIYQGFSECFPDSNVLKGGSGSAAAGQFVSGKKFFARRQPPGDCNLSYAAFSREDEAMDYAIGRGRVAGAASGKAGRGFFGSIEFSGDSAGKALFSEADFSEDANVTFDVNVTPDTEIMCDENVTVRLSVSVPENYRKPIDLMLVIDRSGSMSWGGTVSTTYANEVALDQNSAYAYIADDAAGVRSISISNPLMPSLSDIYDPGTVVDVAVDRNWVFAADTAGTDEIYAINKTDPANFSKTGQISVNIATGIYAYNNYVYLAGRGSSTTGLNIINATNPASMSLSGAVATTSPRDVFVDGNYAYLADGSAGLRAINVTNKASPSITGTYNTAGTAYKVFVSGNYAYVADGSNGLVIVDITNKASPSLAGSYNTPGTAYAVVVDANKAYVADNSALFVLDVNNPAAITQDANYQTPYSYLDVQKRGNYAYLAAGSYGLITIDLTQGPRISSAKESAKAFVDYNGWKAPPDQLGLVSYSSSATTNQTLTTDLNLLKGKIGTLTASGSTYTEAGIDSANTELASARHNPKALKFEVLLSDGQSNVGDSLSAAQAAHGQGIVIFTIGFGADASVSELTAIAQAADGNFYYASDANALEQVFELIALKVAEMASDANVSVPLMPGELIVGDLNGTLMDGNIIFNAGTITKDTPFTTVYKLNFPCTSNDICRAGAFTFPGPGTKFSYYDGNGTLHSIDFNDSATVPFRNRDLNVQITSGSIIGSNNILLGVKVQNTGSLDANATTLNFRLDDTNSEILASYTVPALCSESTIGCSQSNAEFENVGIPHEGVIYAMINEDGLLRECPLGNVDAVNCYGGPATQVFVVEYTVWRK